MSFNDSLSDMLARIKNAHKAKKSFTSCNKSKLNHNVLSVLKDEGYIKSFKIIAKDKADIRLKVVLKDGGIEGLKRFSKPGLRQYRGYGDIPRVLSGLGTAIVSTSKGIVSDRTAKAQKIGGEILCFVW